MGKKHSLADLLLILVTFFWGINFTVAKSAIAEFSPLSFIAFRYGIGAFTLCAILVITREKWRIKRRDWGKLILLGFIGNTVNSLLFITGLSYSTASIAALIGTASPIFVALFNILYGMETLNRFSWIGIGFSCIGITIIIGENAHWQFAWNQEGFKGNLLLIGTTITWAFYTAFGKPILRRYSTLTVITCTTTIGFILLIPFVIPVLLRQNWNLISTKSWIGVLYAAIFSAALAHMFWYYAIKQIGSTRTIIYNNLTPIIGVLTATIYLGERLTLVEILGAVLVVGGIYLVRKYG
jgi:drug/metabolite transporter (DMT)-like permease